MSRKTRKRISNAHLVEHRRDIAKEQEILNSQIYQDPTVQEILRKMVDASELEAVDLALQLQKVARGAASIEESPELSEVRSKMRQEAAARDAAAAAFERDQEGFINGLFEKGEKIKKTGRKADEIRAKAANTLAENVQNARMSHGLKKRKQEYAIMTAPKEKIFVTGVNTHLGGDRSGQWEVWPEEIRIGHMVWRLPPGEHEVPAPVASQYRQMLKAREEESVRSRALSKFSEDRELAREWAKINKEYSGGEPFRPS